MGNYTRSYAQRGGCKCTPSNYSRVSERNACACEKNTTRKGMAGTMTGTCPEGRNMSEWCQMKEKLQSLYFVIVELELYLDGHPYSKDALARYKCAVEEYEELADCYEEKYAPLMARNNNSAKEWLWATSPWPWEV